MRADVIWRLLGGNGYGHHRSLELHADPLLHRLPGAGVLRQRNRL